ncbi:MAG: LptF/LptG family permease [Candidatus Krumholzibacteriota bacterium]|nr:LptF/LptG family permease [Candidatus Krumholzibacteriota bacterium]
MRLADRYILRNHVGPFFLGLSVLTFVFVIDIFYSFLELFLVSKVPVMVVAELILLSLGHIFALTIPMAVLVATMMAFSQMVAENEITAMRSGGISLYRIVSGPFLAALAVTILLFGFHNNVLPETNHRLKNLLMAVRTKKPALDIKPRRFITSIPGYTLYAERKDEATGRLYQLRIYREERGQNPTVIAAREADFVHDEASNLLMMVLRTGEQFEADLASPRRFQITVFDRMNILLRDIDRSLRRQEHEHRGDREMSMGMMRDKIVRHREELSRLDERLGAEAEGQIERTLALLAPAARESYLRAKDASPDSLRAGRRGRPRTNATRIQEEENTLRSLVNLQLSQASVERRILRYEVEIHKKVAIPVSCIVFILLGAPVAIKTGRGGTGWGISFSLLLFTIYYVFLVGGEELADRQYLAPWLAMWTPNILLIAFGAWLLVWTNRESRPFSLLTRVLGWRETRRRRAP